jgi:glutathione peroxidase
MMRKSLFAFALAALAAGVGCASSSGVSPSMEVKASANAETSGCPSALNFTLKSIDGKDVNLCDFQGKVVLMVNVASQCGFTPQYEGLEELNKKYRDRGLRILGFPSNDFGAQEPGGDQEIKKFCSLNYGVTFDMFSKITVKGSGKHPLYQYLTSGGGNSRLAGEVQWNFQKYLIGRDGKLIGVYKSGVEPTSSELTSAIEAALQ